jgi:cell cycle checkpoint protein
MDYPNDREVLEFFECGQSMKFQCVRVVPFNESSPQIPLHFSYTFDVLHHAVRALAVSVKVSIRIDSEGVMSLQFLMPSGPSSERKTWMEFRVSLFRLGIWVYPDRPCSFVQCLAREDNL